MKKYTRLLLVMLVILINKTSPLKAQGNEWKPIVEGKFEVTTNYRVGNLIVTTTVLDNATKPVQLNGKDVTQPINIEDLTGDSFLIISSDWAGDPMNPMLAFRLNDSTLYITDKEKMYKAEIDFKNRSIKYTKVFQGAESAQSDKKVIYGAYFGKNYLYFFGHHFIHLFDTNGNFIKSIRNYEDGEQTILKTTSIVEHKDTVYFGYTYSGGISDGYGLAILDLVSGQITKVRHPEWQNNGEGCTISVIDGEFYLVTDAAKYHFQKCLFKYKNGNWIPVAINVDMPKIWNVTHKLVIGCGKDAVNGNGDTLTKIGCYFTFENGIIGSKEISIKEYLDPRVDIQFSETFKTAFRGRHGYWPVIQFIYKIGNRTIGFGPSIVAELVDTNAVGIKNPIVKVKTILNVFPNPTTGNSVSIQGFEFLKPVEYAITNTAGQLVVSGLTMDKSIGIDRLSPGIYLISFPKIGASARLVRN